MPSLDPFLYIVIWCCGRLPKGFFPIAKNRSVSQFTLTHQPVQEFSRQAISGLCWSPVKLVQSFELGAAGNHFQLFEQFRWFEFLAHYLPTASLELAKWSILHAKKCIIGIRNAYLKYLWQINGQLKNIYIYVYIYIYNLSVACIS